MTCRSQAVQEHASTNLGLEAIIRKALMGKYDRWEDHPLGASAFSILSASLPAALPVPAADGRSERALSSPGLQAAAAWPRPPRLCPARPVSLTPPPASPLLSPTAPPALELLTTFVRVWPSFWSGLAPGRAGAPRVRVHGFRPPAHQARRALASLKLSHRRPSPAPPSCPRGTRGRPRPGPSRLLGESGVLRGPAPSVWSRGDPWAHGRQVRGHRVCWGHRACPRLGLGPVGGGTSVRLPASVS